MNRQARRAFDPDDAPHHPREREAVGTALAAVEDPLARVGPRVERLRPHAGDVILVDLEEEASAEDLRALALQLGEIAQRTRATVLLLPVGVALEEIDEREMLARGWMRVGPLAHTTAQLAAEVHPDT